MFTASEGVHSKPVDIWALGVTLYCMLRGRLPFEADNPLELLERIKTTECVAFFGMFGWPSCQTFI